MALYDVTIFATYADIVTVKADSPEDAKRIVGSPDFDYNMAEVTQQGLEPTFGIVDVKLIKT